MYDLILKNARVVDPVNGVNQVADIGIENGCIAAVEPDLPVAKACVLHDFAGATAIPGIIDTHVHLGAMWGGDQGQTMLAKAGVCTCLDLAGPIDDVIGTIGKRGAGLNIATLQFASPPYTFRDANPTVAEMDALIDASLEAGALGVKLLGGHYPLTPEVSRTLIVRARAKGAYIAWHAGTTEHGSNIEGMREAVEMADGNFLHLPHINSYCRGGVSDEISETLEAIALLKANPNIYSESYISPMNGTRLTCADGVPVSKVTCTCLVKLGFEANEAGIEQGFRAGVVNAVVKIGDESVLVTGTEGLKLWREAGTDLGGSFPVNPPIPRIMLAAAKRESGAFVVDCLSTDGGCIPRNVIVDQGLSQVRLAALSLDDFVRKTSFNPSRMLRLPNKGHLAVGADADITVLDLEAQKPLAAFVAGRPIMYRGLVVGRGANVICTARGERSIRRQGLTPIVVDPTAAPLTMGAGR
ncbi:MAG: amidohydrolase family protein [Burkholderiaceae bacterium]